MKHLCTLARSRLIFQLIQLNIVNHCLYSKNHKKPQLSKQKRQKSRINVRKFVAVFGIILIASGVGYAAINAMIPVNGKVPVLGFPENIYITTKHTPQGFVFASKSPSGGKKLPGITHDTPVIHAARGQLASIHVINEDTTSKHNFNVDEFNVHSKDLGYFETQSITFIADKSGSFRYHCTIHPEMNGEVLVE